jgi:hypothetical protein
MTQQIINVGNVANDGQGTPLRTAFEYINENFTELYGGSAGVTAIVNGTSNVSVVSANGNISTSVNGTSNVMVVSSTSVAITGDLSVSGNATLSGNILGDRIVNGTTEFDIQVANGNANLTIGGTSNVVVWDTTGQYVTGLISASGNVTGGNLRTAGLISATSTITSAANVTGGNLLTAGLISATGNIQGGNLRTAGLISATSTITSAANITGGNLLTGGLISATGTIISAGNLSLTGNIVDVGELWVNTSANGNINLNVNGTGQTNIPTGILSVTGNIQGGNLRTTGLISATSTITSAANITGGNLLTGGLISATGNVAGNYFIGNGSQLTGISAGSGTSISSGTSNVNVVSSGGNVTVGVGGTANVIVWATTGQYVTGLISANGNVTGGNLLTAGLISAASTVTGTSHLGSVVSVSGNVTGGNVIFGSGIVSGTGNIFAGNLVVAGNTATITTANYSIGYLNVPQVSLASNITTALVDSGKHYYSTNSSNSTLTVADNSAVSWPVGTSFIVVNRGTGNVTVAAASGVSLYLAGNSTAANRVLTTYGLATCLNLAANVWMISGSGLA